MRINKKGQKSIRIPPVPTYDIEGMEGWLSELAEEGLFLTKDGFFAGFASFEADRPRKVKYRLEAAQKTTSMWSENGGEPDDEQVELSQSYSWEYVAKRGEFYIYRSDDPSARELNTDPDVQAMALNAAKRRKGGAMLSSLLLFVAYPLIRTRGCLLLFFISLGTWWTALAIALGLMLIADEMRGYFHLKKIQRSLSEAGTYSSGSDWRKQRVPHLCRIFSVLLLAIVLVFTFLRLWSVSVTKEDRIPLSEYSGTLPFATILDIAGEGACDYKQTMTGMGKSFNTLEEKSDILAPRCIGYSEEACVRTTEGEHLDGGLYVDYYELKSEALAKILTKEILRFEKQKKDFELLGGLELPADYSVTYRSILHFPTVLMRKGNIVVRAYFYQTSEYKVPIEKWAELMCDSF